MKKLKTTKKWLLLIMLLIGSLGLSYANTPFVTVWKTDNASTDLPGGGAKSDTKSFRVPVTAGTFSYSYIEAGADESTRQSFTNGAGSTTGFLITGLAASGEYELSISAISNDFVFSFGNSTPAKPFTYQSPGDRLKIINVKQWGDIYTFHGPTIFSGCQNLDVTAADAPKLAGALGGMFKYCENLVGTPKFTNWDLTNVTSININFQGAKKFNQSLGGWNLKNVTNVNNLFQDATGLSCYNFSLTIRGWANNPETPNGLSLATLPSGLTYGDQADYDKLFVTAAADGGKEWTYTNKGTGSDPLSYNAGCGTLLPVTFADLTARISNKQLLVKWKTFSEHNNDKFIVYISSDGKNWADAGTVKTKAPNGNSDVVLEYEYTIEISGLQKAGITLIIALMLAGGLLFNHRKRSFFCMVLLTGVFFTSCNKNGLIKKEIMAGNVYVKVTQIDKDGRTTSTSNVIYVRKDK